MSEVIVFTSGKGGVGKSNLCLNTALELTSRQHRTCLFDGDLGLANVNILLGIDQEYTLDDVVFNHRPLEDILVQTTYGFDIIPGSSGAEQIANLDDSQLESLIGALSGVGEYDYFLIDTASGISKSVMSFCMAARQIVIVITHEATSLTDAYALLKILSVNGYQGAVRILINNCESVPQAKKTYLRYKKVVDKHLDISIVPAGIILHDDHFERAVIQQKPLLELFPDSVGAQCIKAFVANLTRSEADSPEERLADFWQRYLEQIKQDKNNRKLSSGNGENTGGYGLPVGGEPVVRADSRGMPSPARSFESPGFAQMRLPDARELFGSVQSAPGFSSAPAFLAVTFRRLNYGEVDVSELRKLLVADPALAVQSLRLARSRDESVGKTHIERLDQITDPLDDQDIRALLFNAAIAGSVRGHDAVQEDRLLRLWESSYRCGVFARELAVAASFPYPEEAYFCGLFVQIDQFAPDALETAEAGYKGGDAADLLQEAGLSPMMCDAVRFSDYPTDQVKTAFDLVRIVHAARVLVVDDVPADEVAGDELLALSSGQIEEACEKARTEISTMREFLEIDAVQADGPEKPRNGSGLPGYLLDNLLTTTLMVTGGRATDLQDWARRLQRNCSLLFSIDRVIAFVADEERRHLVAVGYPGCFYADSLANFVIPFDTHTSLLSRSYNEGNLIAEDLSSDSDLMNLGDRQLGRLLGGRTLVCIPLKCGGITRGVVACGGDGADIVSVGAVQARLSTLGARAAQELISLGGSLPAE